MNRQQSNQQHLSIGELIAPVVLRAIEVARAGMHTLALVSCGTISDCERIAGMIADIAPEWANDESAPVQIIRQCPCDGFDAAHRECTCSEQRVARWQRSGRFRRAVVAADVLVPVYQIGRDELQPTSETLAEVLTRAAYEYITRARVRPDIPTGAPANLLRAWVDRCTPPARHIDAAADVARTIAAMAGQTSIEARDVAEAVQYLALTRTWGRIAA